MRPIIRFPQGKARAFTMSYDDGVTTDIRLVNTMRAHGVRGTFNINTGMFAETAREYPKGQWGRMTRQQCIDLYGDDMEIALHGATHPFLERLPAANATYEVIEDRKIIEEMTGHPVRGMAYPYGTYSDQVVELLENCGIAYSRTTVSTGKFDIPTDWLRMPASAKHTAPNLMEMAETFLSPLDRYGKVRLFYVWGHSYEFEKDDNWEVIEELIEKVGDRDNVWYATNIEIYDYIEAYNRLRWNLSNTVVENPTATDVWVAYYKVGGKEEDEVSICIPAGTTVQLPSIG